MHTSFNILGSEWWHWLLTGHKIRRARKCKSGTDLEGVLQHTFNCDVIILLRYCCPYNFTVRVLIVDNILVEIAQVGDPHSQQTKHCGSII